MEFKVLGCSGSEAPGVHPCSFMLGDTILFDAGSAARLLSIETQRNLKTIYLTHAHLDHTKDLVFMGENVFDPLRHTITLSAHKKVLAAIHKHLFNGVIWPDFTKLPTPQRPVFRFVPITAGSIMTIENVSADPVTVEACEVNHPGPTMGYLISGPKNRLLYTGDTGPTEAIWQLAAERQVDHILLETSLPNRLVSLAMRARHLTTDLLKEELQKIDNPRVKIHIYHLKAPYQEEVERELAEVSDGRIRLLRAGGSFSIA